MKIVDAYSGRVVGVGDWFADPRGRRVQLAAVVDKSFYDVSVLLMPMDSRTHVRVNCAVRLFHPKYLLQRVAFIPS